MLAKNTWSNLMHEARARERISMRNPGKAWEISGKFGKSRETPKNPGKSCDIFLVNTKGGYTVQTQKGFFGWPTEKLMQNFKQSNLLRVQMYCPGLINSDWFEQCYITPGVTAEGSPALPTTLTTCQNGWYLNTSLCHLWFASEGVSPYYLLPQVLRVVGNARDPSAVTPDT